MKQWRILHTESSRGWGGQELRVFQELIWMRDQGHFVALAAHPESQIAAKAREAGLLLFALDTRKQRMPLVILQLAAWIVYHRFEVINTHSSNDGWLGALAARLSGRRILIRSRHIEVDYPQVFWSRLGFRTLPDFILTTSEKIRQRLIAELGVRPERSACIPTGVDLNRFDPTLKSTLAEELQLKPGTVVLGMISVLRSWKGHAVLLEAFQRLLALPGKLPPLHLIIAGDGPGREELARRIADSSAREQISLLGHRTDVPNLLAGIDLLVLPSLAHEGVPQIILQAQAMGKAVVGSDIGGIPEVVQHGTNGLIFPTGESTLLAQALAELIAQPERRAQFGATARAMILQNYTVDQMGQRLLELYGKLYRLTGC